MTDRAEPGVTPLTEAEVAELEDEPLMVHLYGARRLVGLLLAARAPAGLRERAEAAIWEHGLFIDWEAQAVSCGCGRFAGTMPFMEHVLDALRAALQGADR